MKAIITIVILALLGLGVWWFVRDNGVDVADNSPAAANAAFNVEDNSTDTSGDVDLSEFEDKG